MIKKFKYYFITDSIIILYTLIDVILSLVFYKKDSDYGYLETFSVDAWFVLTFIIEIFILAFLIEYNDLTKKNQLLYRTCKRRNLFITLQVILIIPIVCNLILSLFTLLDGARIEYFVRMVTPITTLLFPIIIMNLMQSKKVKAWFVLPFILLILFSFSLNILWIENFQLFYAITIVLEILATILYLVSIPVGYKLNVKDFEYNK